MAIKIQTPPLTWVFEFVKPLPDFSPGVYCNVSAFDNGTCNVMEYADSQFSMLLMKLPP
jgi:hypothetical protein